jgi:hypothetical protein
MPLRHAKDFAELPSPAINDVMSTADNRTPCPPLGYSRECHLPEWRQIELVAEFHAYRIRPTRIAYRLGIDIALIDALIAGDYQARRFTALVKGYRQKRLSQRLSAAERERGQKAFELRQRAMLDFDNEVGI